MARVALVQPHLLTYMLVTSLVAALAVARLRPFVERGIETVRGTHTAEELLQPRVIKRLKQPHYWRLYSALLFLGSFALFGVHAFYTSGNADLFGLYEPFDISVLGGITFGLASVFLVLLLLFMRAPHSRRVLEVAWAARLGLKGGFLGGLFTTYGALQAGYAVLCATSIALLVHRDLSLPVIALAVTTAVSFSGLPFVVSTLSRLLGERKPAALVGSNALAYGIAVFLLPLVPTILLAHLH